MLTRKDTIAAWLCRQKFAQRMLNVTGLPRPSMTDCRTCEASALAVVGITLDDGYLNNLTHAAPLLERHGFSATCYVVSQLIGL